MLRGIILLMILPVVVNAQGGLRPDGSERPKPELIPRDSTHTVRTTIDLGVSGGLAHNVSPDLMKTNFKDGNDFQFFIEFGYHIEDKETRPRFMLRLGGSYRESAIDKRSILESNGLDASMTSLSGGSFSFWGISATGKIAPGWSDSRPLPYAYFQIGGGRYDFEDLHVGQMSDSYVSPGGHKWTQFYSGGIGIQYKPVGVAGMFLEGRYTAIGETIYQFVPFGETPDKPAPSVFEEVVQYFSVEMGFTFSILRP